MMDQTVAIPANPTGSTVTYYVRFREYIDTSALGNNIEGHKAGGGLFTPNGQPGAPSTYFDSLRLITPGTAAQMEAWISMTIQTPTGGASGPSQAPEISLADILTGTTYGGTEYGVEYNNGNNHSEYRSLRYYRDIKVNNGFMLKIEQPPNAVLPVNILYVSLSVQPMTFPFSIAPA